MFLYRETITNGSSNFGSMVNLPDTSNGANFSGAAYSTTGTSWSTTTLPTNFALNDGTAGGRFVAVGQNANTGIYSNDGVTWYTMTLPTTTTAQIYKWCQVCYSMDNSGNSHYVALAGSNPTGNVDYLSAYSTDGINWTGANTYYNGGAGSSYCTNLVSNPDQVVATFNIGFNLLFSNTWGHTWGATDPIEGNSTAWTGLAYLTGPTSVPTRTYQWVAICPSTGKQAMWDAGIVSKSNSYVINFPLTGLGSALLAAGNGKFLTVSGPGATTRTFTCATTSDDTGTGPWNWATHAFPLATASRLIFKSGLFYASDDSGNYATSPDGITWNTYVAPEKGFFIPTYG